MHFYGTCADPERGGDLLVVLAGEKEFEHFLFALR